MIRRTRRVILIFSQVYVPDPASVGQHICDVATELVRRGHRVRVYTADRGYNDPSIRYPAGEWIDGVEVRRLPLTSLGKNSLGRRALAALSFAFQCGLLSLLTRDPAGIVFTTSPPLAGAAAAVANALRGVPVVYWVMDLNIDQLKTLGMLSPASIRARLLEGVHRQVLARCGLIVTLDRFMAHRIDSKGQFDGRLRVIPPWAHERHVMPVEHTDNPFRQRHGFGNDFIVMHSGNHSPYHPLATLLGAALRLRDDSRIRFVFIGDGLAREHLEATVRQHALTNVIFLPYQPLEQLRYSLSAADLHVVCMGDNMVGLVHPCKVYGAMAVQRPILFIGPKPSHVAELLAEHDMGVHVRHGDVERAVAEIRRLASVDSSTLREMGSRGRAALERSFPQSRLCGKLCEEIERVVSVRGSIRQRRHYERWFGSATNR